MSIRFTGVLAMRATPVVPRHLRDFRHPLYVNTFERLPRERRFFGTETLYGDWDADVLLLAQDCGVIDALDARVAQRHKSPHGHGEGLRTNLNLQQLANSIRSPKLYGSVLGNLWRREGGKSERLLDWTGLMHSYAVPMLEWVVSETRFKAIACLGVYAWKGVLAASGSASSVSEWRSFRDEGRSLDVTIAGRRVRVFAMYHPAARKERGELSKNWTRLARFLHEGADLSGSGDENHGDSKSSFVAMKPQRSREGSVALGQPHWELYDRPGKGVARPLDRLKTGSPRFRLPVIRELLAAGTAGLTEDQCGDIAYPGDSRRRDKQMELIRRISRDDGHPLMLCKATKRVALASFFNAEKR
jgi:hypothetical protein